MFIVSHSSNSEPTIYENILLNITYVSNIVVVLFITGSVRLAEHALFRYLQVNENVL